MIKISILTECEYCGGDGYMPADVHSGSPITHYEPCRVCNGIGLQTKWISLEELADLLEGTITCEPDYQQLAKRQPVTSYADSRDAAGI
jgi:hypothetical protein